MILHLNEIGFPLKMVPEDDPPAGINIPPPPKSSSRFPGSRFKINKMGLNFLGQWSRRTLTLGEVYIPFKKVQNYKYLDVTITNNLKLDSHMPILMWSRAEKEELYIGKIVPPLLQQSFI